MTTLKVLFLLLAISFSTYAQNIIKTLQFVGQNQEPIIGTTVKLQAKDVNQVAISDINGKVKFTLQKAKAYKLTATSVGFKPLILNVNTQAIQDKYVLEEDNTKLKDVEVKAAKPLISHNEDQEVVDVEQLAPSSTNAYEVLEKTPGIFVDSQGNIFLSSSTPSMIYINGREQKMSSADIATLLKSLPANSIEKIEIMRNPSAKYDAASTGGIINIVLKKGVKLGLAGSVNVGMNIGKYHDEYVGANLYNANNDRSSYININYTQKNNFEDFTGSRILSDSVNLQQKTYTQLPSKVLYLGFGFGRSPNKKLDLNFDVNANYNPNYSYLNGQNAVLINQKTASGNSNIVDNHILNVMLNPSFTAKYKLDSIGSEITANLSYNYSAKNTAQDFMNILNENAAIPYQANFSNYRNVIMDQIDVLLKRKNNIKFEFGLKNSFLNYKSASDYSLNSTASNSKYNYNENINAAYLMVSKTIKKLGFKAGFRMENTRMNGLNELPKNASYVINRTDFFPYYHISMPIKKVAGFELKGFLIARKSITRPSYDMLNPVALQLNNYLYQVGNPALKPQINQIYEANISVNDMPIFAVGKNYTNDMFSNVLYASPDNKSITLSSYDNLGKNNQTYFRLIGAIPPNKKYFFVLGSNYSFNHYTGFYQNAPLDFKRGSWQFFTYHRLKINDRSTVSLNGFISINGQQQLTLLENFGSLNMNFNHYLANKKFQLTLYANDMLYSNRTSFSIIQGDMMSSGKRFTDTRRVGITLRYNFGIKPKEEKENMFDAVKQN